MINRPTSAKLSQTLALEDEEHTQRLRLSGMGRQGVLGCL